MTGRLDLTLSALYIKPWGVGDRMAIPLKFAPVQLGPALGHQNELL